MNEQHRALQLQHIREAIAETDRSHTPEQLAQAAHELDCERLPAQSQLALRPSD